MASANPPLIGNWYYNPSLDDCFEVIAMDRDTGSIEIQYIDGELEGLDQDLWRQIRPQNAAPPKDGDAAFEPTGEDHLDNYPNTWGNPLHEIEPESYGGFDDF